ncbi:OmpA family protein [Fulvivirgaceae bacterium BMA10]|uniref:OmpA family protein n=1 Tax=Splendidivirga corallicola TaxID=3051826 RepID=A0ABT8KNS8_9BACT|nr:OmpA family protein [Fulvivirgaceae bacterium BMA10]
MKKHKIIMIVILLGFSLSAHAQLLKKLKRSVKETAEETIDRKVREKTERKTGQAMDSILYSKKKLRKKKKDKNGNIEQGNDDQDTDQIESYDEGTSENFEVYSKFDFVPGEEILLFDDFSLDNIGDFPAKWNTNGSGELVLIGDQKWFMLIGKSTYIPELTNSLPKDYTVEFDMLTNGIDHKTSSQAKLEIWLQDNNSFERAINSAKVEIPLAQYTSAGFVVENSVNGKREIRNNIGKDVRSDILENTHISIAVNGKRIRMWVNENKVVDVPRLVPDKIVSFKLYPRGLRDDQDQIFITNLKIAKGGLDLRSKLLNEGKFSTTGILFNSGSDQIKPESYGVLKQIATALQQEPEINLNIIGHTDADGNEEDNLTLSQLRATSVKNILVSEFGIEADRLQTEGKGESEPIDNNTSAEGKANNRRVEFVKI